MGVAAPSAPEVDAAVQENLMKEVEALGMGAAVEGEGADQRERLLGGLGWFLGRGFRTEWNIRRHGGGSGTRGSRSNLHCGSRRIRACQRASLQTDVSR